MILFGIVVAEIFQSLGNSSPPNQYGLENYDIGYAAQKFTAFSPIKAQFLLLRYGITLEVLY